MTFNTALSGLNAASNDLDVIGNNIANSATVGFKGSRAEFSDVFTSNTYGISQNAVGGGVRLSRVHQSFDNGDLDSTGQALDLAVSGTGFFVMNDQGATCYTRAGQFNLDKENYIVNGGHQRLTGILADEFGVLTGVTGDLQIDTSDILPQATRNVVTGLNLHNTSTPPASDWVGGATPVPGTFNNPSTSTIYDSQGNEHKLSMYFIKADSNALSGAPNASSPPGTLNQWYVAFQIDGQNVPANVGSDNASNLVRINFNQDGTFANAADTGNNPLLGNLIPMSVNLNNGTDPLNMNIDLTTCTQFGSPFSIQSAVNDGYTTGSIAGLEIDDGGNIFGRYSNGRSLLMGQIQLANFADPESLQNIGNTSWAETINSGQPLVGSAGTGGLGFVKSGFLEQSNVNLTAELVDMIAAQRNFQANAQTIRTTDAITQTIINIR